MRVESLELESAGGQESLGQARLLARSVRQLEVLPSRPGPPTQKLVRPEALAELTPLGPPAPRSQGTLPCRCRCGQS